MGEHTYETLTSQLLAGAYEVTFTKVNGEKRVMPCSLNADFLPAQEVEKVVVEASAEAKEVNQTVVRAFAIDKQQWRSFRVENVLSTRLIEA
jgi:predicted phage tail protein